MKTHVTTIAGILVVLTLGILMYTNTIDVPFYFDDYPYIVEDTAIKINALDWDEIQQAALESKPGHRPLSNISFALNYYLHQDSVKGYHIVNIAVHVMTMVFLFLFIRINLLRHPIAQRSSHNDLIALSAAAIWMVIPLHTESVTYIVQRMTSLAAMFYVLSILLYASGRMAWKNDSGSKIKSFLYFTGCGLAGVCALASKENAATLPIAILLYEWFFYQDLDASFLKRRFYLLVTAAVIFGGLAMWYLGLNPMERILAGYNIELSPAERVMTELRIIFYYLGLLVYPLPSRLTLEYSYPLSATLVNPVTTILCLIALVAVMTAAIYFARNNNRLIAFCIIWFLLHLFIESSIIGIEIIYEHRTYLPSMLLGLLFVTFIFRFFREKAFPIIITTCVICLILSFFTFKRNTTWQHPLTFWEDCVTKAPMNYRAHHNLGLALAEEGQMQQAVLQYQKSLALTPEQIRQKNWKYKLYTNLGNALAQTGALEKAVENFNKAIQINPEIANSHYNLATAHANLDQVDKSIHQYRRAIELDPQNANAHNNLAMMLAQKGNRAAAISHLKTTLSLAPGHKNANINLGKLYIKGGRQDLAMSLFKRMLNLYPDPDRFIQAGKMLIDMNRLPAAEEIFRLAIKSHPDAVWAYNNLGYVLAQQNRLEEAVECYKKILVFKPNAGNIRRNISYLQDLMKNQTKDNKNQHHSNK